jgi:hypothetical protein
MSGSRRKPNIKPIKLPRGQAAAASAPPPPVVAGQAVPSPTGQLGQPGQPGHAGQPGQAGQPVGSTPVGGASGQAALAAARRIPSTLSRLRLAAALLVLLVTALTVVQLVLGVESTRQAGADARQVTRIQDVKVDLLRADALATNAFLVGGLEPTQQRADYDAAITNATRTIAAAAQAQPADQAALAELSTLVVRYAANMEVARANNRQGLPVGAAYLRASSNDLRDRGMVLVDALLEANTERAERSFGEQHPVWVALPGLLAVGALIVANQWIAKRFRRRVNPGLLVAAAAVLVFTVAATVASSTQALENNRLADGSYAELVSGAEARSAANAAKSSESLRLVNRGSGKAFEDAWAANAKEVAALLPTGLESQWSAYTQAHEGIVAQDDAGDWDGAVAAATTSDAGGSSPAFQAFDEAIADVVERRANTVSRMLSEGATTPFIIAVLTALAGLGATVAVWRGISRRLEEYS